MGGAALAISYLRRIPLFFEVRDLWPESAVTLGELNNAKAIRLAENLEKACYRKAKKIIVVTKGIYNRLLERGYTPQKLTLIPNGANTNLFQYQAEAGRAIRQKLNLENKFLIIYAGIHGVAQGLEIVVQAAEKLAANSNIHFLFVGEGPVKQNIQTLVENLSLTNITFHPETPRQEIPAFLSAADVALVPLRRLKLFQGALPSKMFDAWACQCPTLVTVDGEARQVLTEAGAGLFAEPEDPQAIADALLNLKQHPKQLAQMGINGRRAVEKRYSRQAQAGQLVELLTQSL